MIFETRLKIQATDMLDSPHVSMVDNRFPLDSAHTATLVNGARGAIIRVCDCLCDPLQEDTERIILLSRHVNYSQQFVSKRSNNANLVPIVCDYGLHGQRGQGYNE